jgi:hypothetical protein
MARSTNHIVLDARHAWLLRLGVMIIALELVFTTYRGAAAIAGQSPEEDALVAALGIAVFAFYPLAGLFVLLQARRVAGWLAPGPDAPLAPDVRDALRPWMAWALCVAVVYFLITDVAQGFSGLSWLVEHSEYAHPFTPLFDRITDDRRLLLHLVAWCGLLVGAGLILALPRCLRRWLEITE